MSICVKKYGGTSVGSIERIEAVAERIINESTPGVAPVVVVSAMAGETNRLVGLSDSVFKGYRGAAYDMVIATGEQVSTGLLSMALEKRGRKSRPYLAHQLGILTTSTSSKARIQKINTDAILRDISEGIIPVIAGFQGVDEKNNITTLGRGGSDTSAVAVAVALKTKECEIYTDVTGVFTADPRLVKKARKIKRLCFEEMMEMASLGSKVLHIRSVEIAAKFKTNIHVRSTFEFSDGTWIVDEGEIMELENPVVTSVTHESLTTVFKLNALPKGPKVLAQVFNELAKESIVVDVISQHEEQSSQRLAFSVPVDDVTKTNEVLRKIFPNIPAEIMEDISKLSIVGVGMRNHPGVAAKFFDILGKIGVPLHLVTTSEIKVSAIIDKKHLEEAANAVHTAFGLDAREQA